MMREWITCSEMFLISSIRRRGRGTSSRLRQRCMYFESVCEFETNRGASCNKKNQWVESQARGEFQWSFKLPQKSTCPPKHDKVSSMIFLEYKMLGSHWLKTSGWRKTWVGILTWDISSWYSFEKKAHLIDTKKPHNCIDIQQKMISG